jgi:hypothetical protein
MAIVTIRYTEAAMIEMAVDFDIVKEQHFLPKSDMMMLNIKRKRHTEYL